MRCSRDNGLTLVEVLVGTAMLAALMAAVLVAAGRADRQRGVAARKLEACAAADGLLEGWWSDRSRLPRNSSGRTSDGEWSWRTSTTRTEEADALGGEVVTLELSRVGAASGPGGKPLVAVEILMPVEAPSETPLEMPFVKRSWPAGATAE